MSSFEEGQAEARHLRAEAEKSRNQNTREEVVTPSQEEVAALRGKYDDAMQAWYKATDAEKQGRTSDGTHVTPNRDLVKAEQAAQNNLDKAREEYEKAQGALPRGVLSDWPK